MDTSLMIWFATAVVCVAIVVYRVVLSLRARYRGITLRRPVCHRIFEFGRESDEFFAPGDKTLSSETDYEYDNED